MKYGGVSFTKFSLAGFDVSFQKPEALITSLWIAFGYFLYRYYQYFSVEGVSKLKEIFETSLEVKCEPIISRIVMNEYPAHSGSGRCSYNLLKQWKWVYHGQIINTDQTGNKAVENFKVLIRKRQLVRGIIFAFLDTVFRNSVVTDYLLPFMLSVFVIWYCGSDNWEGSFLKLIFP